MNTQAAKAFDEIRAKFPDSFVNEPADILINDPGEYLVRARFNSAPPQPSLTIERYRKSGLGADVMNPPEETPEHQWRVWDLKFAPDGQFSGWLERSTSTLRSSTDIIKVIRLLRNR